MSAPSVCCLCLTADRQRLTDRAVQCFLDQTFTGAHLLIYDNGEKEYEFLRPSNQLVTIVRNPSARGHKIGALRNEAIGMVKADIIVHWDSDDWSAPERLEVQVATLHLKAAAGYHNLLFLDTRETTKPHPRAWEHDYHKFGGFNPLRPHVAGSSLAYWRDTWKRTPFSESVTYEDPDWCKRVAGLYAVNGVGVVGVDHPPLIAEVHGGNMSSAYAVFDTHQPHINPEWRRAPEWDEYCRERLYP
jgi:glycosyltransferase involved in cell wall biosynthesis